MGDKINNNKSSRANFLSVLAGVIVFLLVLFTVLFGSTKLYDKTYSSYDTYQLEDFNYHYIKKVEYLNKEVSFEGKKKNFKYRFKVVFKNSRLSPSFFYIKEFSDKEKIKLNHFTLVNDSLKINFVGEGSKNSEKNQLFSYIVLENVLEKVESIYEKKLLILEKIKEKEKGKYKLEIM